MVVGGIMGGTLGFLLANVSSGGEGGVPDADSGSDEELVEKTLVTLGGAIVGAGVGYMMGRSTPKGAHVTNVEPVAPHQDAGLRWWQGGILGLGLGAAAGAGIGKYYDENHDCHCDDPGMGVYTGAVLGGLLGMFMGMGEAGKN